MSRYHVPNCNSAVTGLASGRETRAESSSLSSNFPQSSRRAAAQLVAYKLKCEKEPLNSRLGPPDFHPQNLDCPEETFTKEYVQSGYKEMVEGLEEAKEIMLSQVQPFSRSAIYRWKEAIRKRHRAMHESRAKKRKAGQVYGVPLSGSLLSKRGAFPEQRQCTEESRRRWIEALSQPHKRLRSLADNVPLGYRRKYLLEVLIKNNVPLLRATWFIKVNYLNQVRQGSSGTADKIQLFRTEQWTKDVIEYLQYLLDEFSKKDSLPNPQLRDRFSHVLHHKSEPGSSAFEAEEPSVHFKWSYMVRLLQWHHSEGLILSSLIIEWVLCQLQEKELSDILHLLLPIIYDVIEAVVLSQTYVWVLVGVALRFIREPSPGGSYLVDNSRRAYTCSAVVEMLRYMILAVPDTFVALDCFPLPSRVISHVINDVSYLPKASEAATDKTEIAPPEVAYMFRRKKFDGLYQFASLDHFVSCIQRRSEKLAKSVSPGDPSCSYAKAVQNLDKALVEGDLKGAYRFLFDCFSEGAVDETWILEVNPSLRSSLKWIGTVDLVLIYTIFFLCEWAVSDIRNFRLGPENGLKFSGRKDFSEVYTAIYFLRLKASDLRGGRRSNDEGVSLDIDRVERKNMKFSDIFESPGPIHDILVCWIDQHQAHKGEGVERMQLLLVELTRFGILYPQAYARQLLVSGILDSRVAVDAAKHMRHRHVLKVLPEVLVHDSLKDMKVAEGAELTEVTLVYSNERQLIIQEYYSNRSLKFSSSKQKYHRRDSSSAPLEKWKSVESPSDVLSFRKIKSAVHVDELKTAISILMQFPTTSNAVDTVVDESEGVVKRSGGSMCSGVGEVVEGTTSGCEDKCRRVKKQKITEERSLYIQLHSPNPTDEDDLWWARKGPKQTEPLKIEPSLKSAKQNSRGRRKTQSLAQLAAARIEGSQGVSTSHVCDNRIVCPHHRGASEAEIPKAVDGSGPPQYSDIISIGKALKRLRFAKRRAVTSWLVDVVRQHIEVAEKASSVKVGQFNRTYTPLVEDVNPLKWKLTEEELSAILYLLDVSNDLLSAVKFLLWLLPKAPRVLTTAFHSGRNMLTLQRQMENHICEIGEAVLLSSLRRYETTLIAADLVPQALSVLVQRAASVAASSGRVFGTSSLSYAWFLLKKFGNVNSVVEWRKNFKATCDKRLFSELESARLLDGEYGFSLGVPSGVDDADDFLRQKLSGGRISRVGMTMREIVQRHMDDAFHVLSGKDKKVFVTKVPTADKVDDGQQKAQQIVAAIMDCMRQTGGAAQEGDPYLVSSAVSAIVGSVGPTLAKIPDFAGTGFLAAAGSLFLAKRILQIHISCLCLLKEALDERQSRVFEVALAMEASSALSGVFSPGKLSRNQYQMSPEAHDSGEGNDAAKSTATRPTKITAAVSALVIGTVLQGITSLERIVTVFRLKEGLDLIQFVRSTRSSSNGNMRTTHKGDGLVELHVHWFRVLIGNCRTISDGLISELLGEQSVLALWRMQQSLPLGLVFPAAYSIFAFLMWKPFIFNSAPREDAHQLYQSLNTAIVDALNHLPFRDVCLRNTRDLYDLIAADTTDAEFASVLESSNSDSHLKAFFPLRARLFLDSIIDGRMPGTITHEDRKSGRPELETKLVDKIVHVLNTLQPAKFHWQWLELRLLLNEQAILERLENHDVPLPDALRSVSPSSERSATSENENNFIEIILTRLLVRPDAAPLYSEVVHLFGRSLEDSLLLLTKWFLEGSDVLLGRKTVRQRLMNIAGNKGLSTATQFYKHWGWSGTGSDALTGSKKHDRTNLEEGEVVEEGLGLESRKSCKGSTTSQVSDAESNYRIEKALVELVLPCMDQSSVESRNTFASDLIKQLNAIEQQMGAVARGTTKHHGTAVAAEGPTTKSSSRKGSRGGSPSLARRQAAVVDAAPPSPAALRASIILRLHFLLRLLPVICTDREPLGKNMRHMLSSVMLRLLGNRFIYEDAELSFHLGQSFVAKKEGELSSAEASSAASPHLSGESLFDRLLLILHGLLSSSQPSWLKSTKTAPESSNDFSPIDKEVAENLQSELEAMHLPDKIRWRIQSAIPVLLPSVRCSISCEPSPVPTAAVALLQPTQFPPGNPNPTQRNPISGSRTSTSSLGKSKAASSTLPPPEIESELDSWTLLEDGVGSVLASGNVSAIGSGDDGNVRASSWLKGAVRVRRTNLLYVSVVDDDNC